MSPSHIVTGGAGIAGGEPPHPRNTEPPPPLQPPQRKRPGPKPLPLSERKPPKSKPGCRRRHSYTREKKLEVLQWVVARRSEASTNQSVRWAADPQRARVLFDASEYFKIPLTTISHWESVKEEILRSRKGARRNVVNRKKVRPHAGPGEDQGSGSGSGSVEAVEVATRD